MFDYAFHYNGDRVKNVYACAITSGKLLLKVVKKKKNSF